MALATIAAEGFLYQILSADEQLAAAVGGRIYNGHAPQRTPYPFVTYHFQGGVMVNNGMFRLMESLLYLVKVICKTPVNDVVRLAANRIDEVCGAVRNGAGFGFSFNSWREKVISYPETDTRASQSYLHLGGLYRFEAFEYQQ
jgi:hypothetical protein